MAWRAPKQARQPATAAAEEATTTGTRQFFGLPRTVIVLGLVSLLNDAASEMITPLLPIFLTATLGVGPAAVGLVEGVAEATSSALKLVSGRLADRGWNSKGMVLSGYGLSNGARPLIGLAFGWGWVLLLRFFDRVGKGVRTSPRDGIIAATTSPDIRGRAFGFHRALDHGGAVAGPLIAFVLLGSGIGLRHVFLLSVIPGVLVLALLALGLPARPPRPAAPVAPPPLRWRALDRHLRALILATGGLALATTPEVFLVLWAQSHGLAVVWIPLVWAAASAVKAAVAIPGGQASDRLGRLPLLVLGWTLRIGLLMALAWTTTHVLVVWALFLAYAASLAITEGPERALVGDYAPSAQRATAYGLYHMIAGLLALPGAVLFGEIWQAFGEEAAFLTAAALTAVAVTTLLLTVRRQRG